MAGKVSHENQRLKKTRKIVRLTFFLSLSIILVLSAGCRKKTEVYRFIDHLEKTDVLSSPLIDLENKFDAIEGKFTAPEMKPWGGDEKNYDYFPLPVSVLSWDETIHPPGMQLDDGENAVDFSSSPKSENSTWKWRRIQETIDPRIFQGYTTYNNLIVLNKGSYFTAPEMYFPEAEYTFEFEARSNKPRKYLPRLQYFLDDILVDEFAVKIGRDLYRSHFKIPEGKHKLRVGFSDVVKLLPYEEEETMILGRIHIRSDHDFLLVTRPQGEQSTNSGSSFRFTLLDQPKPHSLLSPIPNGSSSILLQTGITLKDQESFEKTVDIPYGPQILEILCHSEGDERVLSLWIDEKKVGEKKIASWLRTNYSFAINGKNGSQKLKLLCRREGEGKNPDSGVNIHRMEIVSPHKTALTALCRFKEQAPIKNLDVKENPYFIKKKVRVNEYDLNTLFAPPGSEYRFKVKVPKSGVLECKVGCLEELSVWDEENNESVVFSIHAQKKNDETLLFTQKISTSSPKYFPEMKTHKIDLSPYAGKTLRLHLRTDSSLENESSQVYPYWYNPVVYSDKENAEQTTPNIILISIDTLRSDHLGCYGYERETSPSIDELAENSALFMNCHSPTGKTLPAHMSMFTSLYPIHHRMLANGNRVVQRLDESILILAEPLRKNGYFTGAFTGGAYLSAHYGYSKGFDFYHGDPRAFGRETAPLLYAKSGKWLEENRNKKFFLFLHTYQVHGPYSCPEPFSSMFADENAKWKFMNVAIKFQADEYMKLSENEKRNLIALYDGEIRYTDELFIKPLIELLKKLEIFDNTLIVLTSDHGEEFYDHRGWQHGLSLYGEQIKVPLIMKFPGSKYRGKRIASNVSLVDLMPTILESAGIRFSGYASDGISLLGHIQGKKPEDRTIMGSRYIYMLKECQKFVPFLLNFYAVHDSMKLILNRPHPGKNPMFFIPSPPPFPVDETELFDLVKDPEELKNVIESNRLEAKKISDRTSPNYSLALQLERETWKGKTLDPRLLEQLKALGYIR
jgi:arylsulfatase A-like enzyme